ncbi:hypothetical protein HPB52_014966 [Rhipicephalus sanguineus]|uniref:Tetraspanin n=1 Tax=Rhipicephalus sanguineus TaxID=34632 RepID=A0A9D4Q0J1_RHISA|nr:hypothetical protein HPB52_014966 [Rhipicephalus sanguineus]
MHWLSEYAEQRLREGEAEACIDPSALQRPRTSRFCRVRDVLAVRFAYSQLRGASSGRALAVRLDDEHLLTKEQLFFVYLMLQACEAATETNVVAAGLDCKVTGLVLLILGVWMNVSLYHVLKLSTDYNRHMPLLFIATGLLVLLVAVLACVATAKGQSVLLYIFGSLLVLVFVAELTAGIVGYVYIRQVREGIGRGMNVSITHYNGNGGMADETVDFVQDKASTTLTCCGLKGPEDWNDTEFFQKTKHYPKSCCSSRDTCTLEDATLHQEQRGAGSSCTEQASSPYQQRATPQDVERSTA